MLKAIEAALDEVRHHNLVEGEWVRNLLLDLRSEAALVDALVLLAEDQAASVADLSD